MKTIYLILFSFSVLIMNSCYYTETADILIHNAKIYSVNENFDVFEAMAIKDGKIIDIGPNNELKNRYESKEIIDAQLKIIYPGLIDAHCHFLWYGNTFNEVDLVGSKSWQEALERIQKFAKTNKNEWIVGRGWDQNDWAEKEFPNNSELNRRFPNTPVFLTRIDFHAAMANNKALEIAGIKNETIVEGGVIALEDGYLTGLLIDKAITLVSEKLPKMSTEAMAFALKKAQEMCFEKGLTSVADAYLENDMVHVIDSMQQSGELTINIYGMLVPSEENRNEFLENGPYVTKKLNIHAFKFFADGALGSRGAKLIEPYHDDALNSGLSTLDTAEFLADLKLMFEKGYQVNTHCIGDGANRQVLDAYAEVLKGTNDKRWRIEHAQILTPSDFEKFRKFTIIPSVQPTHATSDMPWAQERLGKERMKNSYAYKKLLSMNGIIALGTDFPIEDIDPLKTFYAATIRKNVVGKPNSGFQTENALSREEAIRGMTIWAAVANFEDTLRGSLEKGKVADFVILDKDLMEIEESKILQTKVIATYIDGNVVFSR
ncbi:amidohydrolase [Vicingaceae bacterium]|nr:amidohydrolase [Vicingaceae bacterium]MDB4082788.1 amidohydrolase [Vicingaceae bacterium]